MNVNYKLIILAMSLFFTLSASMSAAPGDLDPSFGNGGIAITRGETFSHVNAAGAMAIQPDGKIVVAGEGHLGNSMNWDSAVVRYNPDGSLDNSFGGTGIVVTQFSIDYDGFFAVAIQADGKIVVAGSTFLCNCTDSSFAIARYNPDGSLDASFNGTGKIITAVGDARRDYAESVAIQADGKIVVVGRSGNGGAIVRYNSDGSLDTTFNGTGKLFIDGYTGVSVVIQADGKIIVVGNNNNSFKLYRLNPDASPDPSFNGTGQVVTSTIGATDVAIQPDGKIVVSGSSYDSNQGQRLAVVRFNPNGSIDTSFGNTGRFIAPLGVFPEAVAIQADGKIVAAGNGASSVAAGFGIVRLNPNGSLDTSFKGTGIVLTQLQGYAIDVGIQADGKIVVAGSTDDLLFDFYDFVVARYEGGPTSTPTPSPIATPTPTPTPTASPGPRPNGKIAFTSDRDGNREIYVMNADGTNQIRLTNNNVVDDHPAWSPDGTKIAFVSEIVPRPSGNFAIFQMNADGTNKVEITTLSYIVNAISYLDFWSMSWSPDGSKIAFPDGGIFVVNADGSDRRRLTAAPDGHPAWSPDGSKILFSASRDHIYPTLYTVKPDGTGLQAFPGFDGKWEIAPDWSPSGNRVVFVSDFTDSINTSQIFTQNADGTNRQHFDGVGEEAYRTKPSWSPDGSKIIFDKFEHSNGDMEIFVKNTDGSGLAQLTNTSGWNYHPSWQPLSPAACPNPIDCPDFFVRQHYGDFLNREPDQGGWDYWTAQLTACGNDPRCMHERRIGVSAAFFIELEFQRTGYVVYRMHRAAFGTWPGAPTRANLTYTQFTADRALLPEGSDIAQTTITFANGFVSRPEFFNVFPATQTNAEFVNELFDTAGLTPYTTERQQQIQAMNAGKTRAQVLLDAIEIPEFKTREYNRSFVLMEYFGYLRRDPDQGGYDFWLNVLDNREPNNFRGMVCGFITSTEYQVRFGNEVTRSNRDCQQQ